MLLTLLASESGAPGSSRRSRYARIAALLYRDTSRSRIRRRLGSASTSNTGKRGAQVTVLKEFERDEYDFVLTVDSDSVPFPDACEQLLKAMHNPKIQAATGMIYIRNHDESWVSLGADIDIGTSCVMMRASRSMIGALETTSGALALYRSSLLYDHLGYYAPAFAVGIGANLLNLLIVSVLVGRKRQPAV